MSTYGETSPAAALSPTVCLISLIDIARRGVRAFVCAIVLPGPPAAVASRCSRVYGFDIDSVPNKSISGHPKTHTMYSQHLSILKLLHA